MPVPMQAKVVSRPPNNRWSSNSSIQEEEMKKQVIKRGYVYTEKGIHYVLMVVSVGQPVVFCDLIRANQVVCEYDYKLPVGKRGAAEIVLVSVGNLQLADQLGYLRRPADP